MYKKNEYVVNKAKGLCLIVDICKPTGMNYKCYLLKPVITPGLEVYIPIKNASIHLRKPVTAKEALSFIENLPNSNIDNIKDSKTKNNEYKKMLVEATMESLCSLVKVLYAKQKELAKEAMYTNVLKTAETLLLTELGYALDKTNDEIKDLIISQIEVFE